MNNNIKDIVTKKFPDENAICVLTRYTENLRNLNFTKSWKININRAKKFKKVLIIDISDEKRGEYLLANIKKIVSIHEIKELLSKNNLTADLQEVVKKDISDFGENSIFHNKNISNLSQFDESRVVIFFERDLIEEGVLQENFKSFGNPVFYIDKHFTTEQLEDLKITQTKLSNFLNFLNLDIEFSTGINLFIGENNIGKTGILKFLYSNVKAYENYSKLKNTSGERTFKELLSIKLQNTFQSDEKIGSIVCKQNDNDLNSSVTINDYDNIKFSFKKTTKLEVSNLEFPDISKKNLLSKRFNTVFIPAKEILSISKIIELAKNRFSIDGFDDTYNDLVEDIEPHFLKTYDDDKLNEIVDKFKNDIIEGKIEFDFDKSKYYYEGVDGFKYDLTMTAEGVKQLGIIPILIKTGKIKKGTILFLDEPDNNLNPVAIRKFVYTLFDLASVGVQIFITTHNHLFSQYISLFNEYKETFENFDFPKSKFFALFKDKSGKTNIETGDDLLDLSNNLILDEYVKLHDKEEELIFKMENK